MNQLVVSSTICEDPADQNHIQSQDDLTNPNPSETIETSENDNESILGSECVAKNRLGNGKRHIDTVYEDPCINGDKMQIDSSKFQRRSSRVRKTVDTFILSDVTEIES